MAVTDAKMTEQITALPKWQRWHAKVTICQYGSNGLSLWQ